MPFITPENFDDFYSYCGYTLLLGLYKMEKRAIQDLNTQIDRVNSLEYYDTPCYFNPGAGFLSALGLVNSPVSLP